MKGYKKRKLYNYSKIFLLLYSTYVYRVKMYLIQLLKNYLIAHNVI